MRKALLAGLLAAAITGGPPAAAAVPQFINFQGRLLASDGTPEVGILSIGFALYDVETGGSPLWSETQSVSFAEGFYSVMLGTVSPLPLSVLNDPLWLSATIAGTELLPRMQVGSVAFALRASIAEGLTATATGSGSGLDADSLDGLDATDVALAGHTHPAGDADTLDGIDSTGFAGAGHTHPAGDADTLDGIDSTGFAGATHNHDTAYLSATTSDTMSGDLTVTGSVSAASFTAGDATVRASGELVYRGSIPVWVGSVETVTDAANWQRVSGTGLCTTCYPEVAALTGTTRTYRFTILYSDSQDACGLQSDWRLGRHDDSTVSYFDWTLPRTWSGTSLYHMRSSPFFGASALSNCDGGWAGGTCSIYARLAAGCTADNMEVRGIYLEYYDQLP